MLYRVGQKVRYYPVVGGEHDGKVYEIHAVASLEQGHEVAWLRGKDRAVSAKALSPYGPCVVDPEAIRDIMEGSEVDILRPLKEADSRG